MEKPDQSNFDPEIIKKWSDRSWRLNNLYYIQNKHGEKVKFKLNPSQAKLLANIHYLNIILKARQMGFSTFILILALDCCLFNSNFAAGLIADTIENAKNLLKRINYAYAALPEQLQGVVSLEIERAINMEFSNGSSIEVGVSLRSTTKNFLHVSEYGKICARTPEKAKEIRSGALNTVAPEQLVFIESTAEGRGGDFYDKTETARKIEDAGREPYDIEYKLHFFPWFMDATYQQRVPEGFRHTADSAEYFRKLEKEHGITLTDEQKFWYAKKKEEQSDDMWKEYPSTPEEAFLAAKDGAYWGSAMRKLRIRKLIGTFPLDPRTPVNTFWDWGISDFTTIWFHQIILGRHRFVSYFEDSGEGVEYYINHLNDFRSLHNCVYGQHFGPHDFETRRPGRKIETIKDIAGELGYKFEIVERTTNKANSIQNVRTKLPMCEFDDAGCDKGISHLEEYSRDWDEKLATWKSYPRHDEHSHGADGFMTFADGYVIDVPTKEWDDYEEVNVA